LDRRKEQKSSLSSKDIHESYETFIVLKKEIQYELKMFIDQILSNKNKIANLSKLIEEYNANEQHEYDVLAISFKYNKLRYKEDSSDETITQAKTDFRKIFEIKHLQDLIVVQNNYKTLKRKTQSLKLNLRAAGSHKEGYSQETIQVRINLLFFN